MPFVWSPVPELPEPNPPQPVPEGTIVYEVNEVANLVNAGGSVLYNTPNTGYDIVYELSQINVGTITITTAQFQNLTITGFATINSLSANIATINTATINTATVQIGSMGGLPGSNLEIATKEYVDAAAANVPAGGSDLQNIIDAPGDLLVGIAPSTATRLPVGTIGQILRVDLSTNTGLRWVDTAIVESGELFSGLWLQTHFIRQHQNTSVVLRHADEIIMQDGTQLLNWNNVSASIEVSGAGGLDTGSPRNSQWYEIYAIAGSITENRALLLHRGSNIILDKSLTTTTNNSRDLRRFSGPATLLTQQFIPGNTGPVTSVELELTRTGTPPGYIWATIETDVSGFPSGTPLATSRVIDASRLTTDKGRVRFVYDANSSITQGSTYHIVLQGDYPLSDSNYVTMWGLSTSGYPDGDASQFNFNSSTWFKCLDFSGPADFWFKVFIQNIPRTLLTRPTDYDLSCLLGYVYRNEFGNFKHFMQVGRTITTYSSQDWKAFVSQTGLVETADLTQTTPPRDGVVRMFAQTLSTTPLRHIPVGIHSATDLSINTEPRVGSTSANLQLSAATNRYSIRYPLLSIEHQAITTRMQLANNTLYVVEFSF